MLVGPAAGGRRCASIPTLPADAVDQVVATVLRAESQNAHGRERAGAPAAGPRASRSSTGVRRRRSGTSLAWLVDFEHPREQRLAGGQPVHGRRGGKNRRPDVVVFVNGLPLALIELKNPGDEHATLKGAWNQVQTYRNDIPAVFTPNAVCVVSDGLGAVMGSFSAGFEHYAPWKTIDGREVVTDRPQLEVLIRGRVRAGPVPRPACATSSCSRDEPAGLVKRVAKYHQYWAVNAAVESTIEASGPERRPAWWRGVAHPGLGQELRDAALRREGHARPAMGNPTLVLITDRNDLDDQLFGEVFAPARILPETPRAGGLAAPSCARCSTGRRAASSSPRSRSSRPTSRATCTRC